MLSLYLALKEMARHKRRFAVVFLIVALVTLLVLLTAALGDGLVQGASEYLEQQNGELLVFQEDVDYQLRVSRLSNERLKQIRRVPGVAAVGPIGVSTASIVAVDGRAIERLDASLIGFEPRAPGAPQVFAGTAPTDSRAAEVVLDRHVQARLGLQPGATITIKVIQGMQEQHYDLQVLGFADGSKVNYTPGIFVPLRRWDRIRPQEQPGGNPADLIFNIVAVRLDGSLPPITVATAIEERVPHVEVTDPVTAYETTQGYRDMQSTLNLQQGFVLLIVVLIVGSFFQIQTLQKVAQIGMLEAIGASSQVIIATLLIQIMLTLLAGLAIGGTVVWLLAQAMPTTIPMVFDGAKITTAVLALLAAGPIAALIAVRTILQIEPLQALGLSE